MARRPISGARVLLTGASSGIGRALALELARHGARLLLTARREERLAELVTEIRAAGGDAEFVAGDITAADLRQRLVERARTQFGELDLLINNAGIGGLGPFADADEARLRRIMEVNFFAPVELTRATLPLLRLGQRPMLVNVGSVLGHRAVPKKSEYCASKFALHGFSDSLRAELATHGVDVLLVSPSTTDSEFFDHVLADTPAPPTRKQHSAMSPAAVAKKTVSAIRRGQHELILSPGGKLLVWLDRLFPTWMNQILAHWG